MKKYFLGFITLFSILNLFLNAPYAFALTNPAFDNFVTNFVGGASGTINVTLAHTNSSNECDIIYASTFNSGGSVTGVTDNGVSAGTAVITGIINNQTSYNVYFVSPAPAGSVTVSETWTGAPNGAVLSATSYTGCGGKDTQSSAQTVATSVSDTFTTNFPTDTVVSYTGNGNASISDTWGGTNRGKENNVNNSFLDDKAETTAGSVTTSWTSPTGTTDFGSMDIALCPVGGCIAATALPSIAGLVHASWW